MKKLHHLLIALSLGATAGLSAQTSETPPEGPRGPHRGGPHGPGAHIMHFRGGPGLAVVRAVDADQNRELSSSELANAPASIRTLDADTDGTIARNELRPTPLRGPKPPAGAPGRLSDARKRSADAPERSADAPDRPARLRERPADAPQEEPGRRHHRKHRTLDRAADPVMLALDANSDGTLSDSEVANATTSLSALDLNQDGTLTMDELRPLPPEE